MAAAAATPAAMAPAVMPPTAAAPAAPAPAAPPVPAPAAAAAVSAAIDGLERASRAVIIKTLFFIYFPYKIRIIEVRSTLL
ncbi:hypothetical protein CF122_14040 [Aeromonas media]|nr:hypothetical protein CF122_14040 [Aeromonas media]